MTKAIVLAAGEGKRMKSSTPKVLHKLAGKPILEYVLDTCKAAGADEIIVVIGHQGETVKDALTDYGFGLFFAVQDRQQGTGHAVLCAKDFIKPQDRVLILCGDTPLISADTVKALLGFQAAESKSAVVAAAAIPDPGGYGRVITDSSGFKAIVEDRDLHESQRGINLINTGVYVFEGGALFTALGRVTNHNSQGEYYLTDVPGILANEPDGGCTVFVAPDYREFLGINSQAQLAEAAAVMRAKINYGHMENGVTLVDPAAVYIDCEVEIGAGTVIEPGAILEAGTKVAENALIGAGTRLTNALIGANSTVKNSVVVDSSVGENTTVGPFAYLRGETAVGANCRIGDFVELKNAKIAANSTAAHLAYIGDAVVGSGVNFGCGAITVNYDGTNKNTTTIEDDCFIGSNVNLVAPITVHKGSFVAAGSTITEEVPEDALAIARSRQVIKEGRAPKRVKRIRKWLTEL